MCEHAGCHLPPKWIRPIAQNETTYPQALLVTVSATFRLNDENTMPFRGGEPNASALTAKAVPVRSSTPAGLMPSECCRPSKPYSTNRSRHRGHQWAKAHVGAVPSHGFTCAGRGQRGAGRDGGVVQRHQVALDGVAAEGGSSESLVSGVHRDAAIGGGVDPDGGVRCLHNVGEGEDVGSLCRSGMRLLDDMSEA